MLLVATLSCCPFWRHFLFHFSNHITGSGECMSDGSPHWFCVFDGKKLKVQHFLQHDSDRSKKFDQFLQYCERFHSDPQKCCCVLVMKAAGVDIWIMHPYSNCGKTGTTEQELGYTASPGLAVVELHSIWRGTPSLELATQLCELCPASDQQRLLWRCGSASVRLIQRSPFFFIFLAQELCFCAASPLQLRCDTVRKRTFLTECHNPSAPP